MAILPPNQEQNLSASLGNSFHWTLLPESIKTKEKQQHLLGKLWLQNLTWQSPPTNFWPTVGAGESRTNIFRHMSHWSTNLGFKNGLYVKNPWCKYSTKAFDKKIVTCFRAVQLYWFLGPRFEGEARQCFESQWTSPKNENDWWNMSSLYKQEVSILWCEIV